MASVEHRVVVDGEIGTLYAGAFEGMRVDSAGGKSTIVGPVEDEAELQGLLARIASLGLALISVVPVDG